MHFVLRATIVTLAVTAAVAASINVASAESAAPEPTVGTSPGLNVMSTSDDPPGAVTTARPVAGRVTGKSCTNDRSHRISRSGKTSHDLVYYACVDVLGSTVRARGKWKRYYNSNKHINRNAPEFYWFKTYVRLETGSATSVGVCSTRPRPSDFIDQGHDIYGHVKGYHRHYAHTCYFDRNQQRGKFYRVSVQHSYDIKGDGKYTLYSPKIHTNYVRG